MQATAAPRGHVRHSRYRRTFRVGHLRDLHVLRWLVPSAIGIGAVLALILAIDPAHFASAIEHLNLLLLPAIVAVSLAYYVIQGIRWHFLLVDVGIRLRLRDVVLITLAGQATSFLAASSVVSASCAALAPIIGGLCADFFADHELSLGFTWKTDVNAVTVHVLNLHAWTFFFGLAFMVGLLSLHRLSFVQEANKAINPLLMRDLLLEARNRNGERIRCNL